MDVMILESNLDSAEGCPPHIYPDDKGNPTGGIGHLILPTDINPETGAVYKIGDLVPSWQVQEWFEADKNNAFKETVDILQHKFGMTLFTLPNYVQEARRAVL